MLMFGTSHHSEGVSESVQLEEVIEFVSKTGHRASVGRESGKFKFFSSSPCQSKFTNFFDFDSEYLIFGTGGTASVHYVNDKFSVTADCLVARVRDPKYSTRFIYYYLHHNIHLLEKGFRGAGLKHISKSFISQIRINISTRFEQDRTVVLCEKLNELYKYRTESDKLTNDYLISIFFKMFGDPIKNPMAWNFRKLEELAELRGGIQLPTPILP
jgi:type I restriction enzyme S subunit